MKDNSLIVKEDLTRKIHTFRNINVMLDSDLAELYNVPTGRLNEAVKRNIGRFPEDFMFQLTSKEFEILMELTGNTSINGNRSISQFAISNKDSKILKSQFVTTNPDNSSNLPVNISNNDNRSISQFVISKTGRGGRQKLPFVFTEQGVAMLSGVLKSERAIQVNIYIMRAFVAMRKFIQGNADVFRMDHFEKIQIGQQLQINHINKNIGAIFSAMEDKVILKKQKLFYDGQTFDAYKFVNNILKSAKKSIILMDNYVDESVLVLFSELNVKVAIYTENLTEKLKLDIEKYNQQYPKIEIKTFKKCHDRFLIIDHKEIYHFGASIKDLGKKWFVFSKMDKTLIPLILKKLN
ncbi:MAG: ORF6N domain-containing protein [archaeon]|jgi:hypothetical protein